jgi:hypothetical protein
MHIIILDRAGQGQGLASMCILFPSILINIIIYRNFVVAKIVTYTSEIGLSQILMAFKLIAKVQSCLGARAAQEF